MGNYKCCGKSMAMYECDRCGQPVCSDCVYDNLCRDCADDEGLL